MFYLKWAQLISKLAVKKNIPNQVISINFKIIKIQQWNIIKMCTELESEVLLYQISSFKII